MLLSSYYVDKTTHYCRHLNQKNLELCDILIDSDRYINNIDCDKPYHVCVNCIPIHYSYITNKVADNVYDIRGKKGFIGRLCICKDLAGNGRLRHLIFGKYVNTNLCRDCLFRKWNQKTCEDCGEKNPNDIFKTICDTCILMKSKELHLCTYHLDYNTDITCIIIEQLQDIKNYFIGLKN
jgi:hypothetical protein